MINLHAWSNLAIFSKSASYLEIVNLPQYHYILQYIIMQYTFNVTYIIECNCKMILIISI